MNWPINWEKCSVSDVAEVFLGKTPKKSQYLSEGNNKIIKFRDIKQGQVDFDNNKEGFVLNDSNLLKSLRRLNLNDILITSAAHSGENIGKKCAIVKNMPEKYANFYFTGELLNIRSCSDESLAKWLYFFFSSKMGLKEIQKAVSGVHLTSGRAKSMQIVIAPDKERDRIVAKLEKLLAKVDQAQARLEKIPGILKQFRMAVLAAACSGGLTREWRLKKHNQDRDGSPDAPVDWEEHKIKDLSHYVTSGSRGWAKYYSDKGPYFIRAQDIKADSLNLENAAHVELPEHIEGKRTKVQKGDILVTITGANVTKTALVDSDIGEAYVNQHVALIRPKDTGLSEYLYLWIVSPKHGRQKLLKDAYGAGKPGLNLDNIRTISVNIPPAEERELITERTRQLFQIADQLDHRYQKAKTHIDHLTQSILAKAFRGELVPQDPNDEPASELLKRIKAGKARQEAESKPNRKPKAKKGRASKKAAV
ncbi:MAG: restriction endonuclease subunit S [Desulfobacterales bacterium]|nr:restriction endonuclease subunit S [Desulfobacterales bacterium]